MKTQLLRFWLLFVFVWTPSALWAGQRVALVVGCGKYASVPGGQPVSPAVDSADVAVAFKKLGYTLVGGKELKDPSRDELTGAVERFADAARGAEAAVFYFSGHGVQAGEDNYLFPVDAPRLTGLDQLKSRAVNLRDSVMVPLGESGVATKVIVLDCCRDNPFGAQLESAIAQEGTALKIKSVGEITGYGPGFYLAFATNPGLAGSVGHKRLNSPFTTAFLKTLKATPSKHIDLFFREVRKVMPADLLSWTNSTLTDEFSLGPQPVAPKKLGPGAKQAEAYEKLASEYQNRALREPEKAEDLRKEAERLFREAIRLNPHTIDSLNNLSVLLRSQGNLAEAVDFQLRAVKERPAWGLMHRNLASIYAQQRRFPEAIEAFSKAVEFSPGDLEACYNLGLLLSETSQGPEILKNAADCFRRTISLQPRFAEGHFSLGNILYRLGKQEEALDSYKRAIEADPKHSRAYNNLASLLGTRGDKTSAVNYYQSAISLDPNYLEAYRNLAESLLKNGAAADAVKTWKACLARGEDLQAMYRLSWILGTHPDVNIHNAIEARDLANKGIELTHGKEPAFHDSLGAALAQLGKYEEALAAAKKALEIVPGGEQGQVGQRIKARIELYKNKAPYREVPPTQ